MRTYAPVIVRGAEDQGVQIWGFGKMVYQSLLNIMLDEDYGDITAPASGRDVKVICTKQPGRKWANTEVRPRGKESALSSNPSTGQEWMQNIPDVADMFELKSYDELSKIINDWLNDDTDSSDGTERFGSTSTDETSSDDDSQASSSYKSLDDAYAD